MIKDFFDGIRAYGKAIQLISSMGLWGFVLVPGLISLLLAGGIGATAWALSGKLGAFLISWYPFSWGADTLLSISAWIGGILIGLLGIIIYKHLVIVIVSPFMSPLSQKIEEKLTGIQDTYSGFELERALKELVRGLRLALRNIIRETFFVFLLFLLGLIPIFSPFIAIAIFLVQAYYAGFGNMDYTLERHLTMRDSIHFVRRHYGLAMGNGSVFLLLLMTGIGFIVAPPLATIAGTIETVKRFSPIQENVEQTDDYV